MKISVMIVAFVCLFWIHPAFAADGDSVSLSTEVFNAVIKFLSW